MALYFLVLDSPLFQNDVRPALSASWRQRTFEPCRELCNRLLPAAHDFAGRNRMEVDEPLLAHVARGLPFDRVFWQHLAGELLWFTAVEIPEISTSVEALTCLLAPGHNSLIITPRSALPPIVQAHHGSRELQFGAGFYRPENAGWNTDADVVRLADYLGNVHPELWYADALAALPELPEGEREEELAFVRDWFGPLREMYATAAGKQQIIVCETL